MSGGLNPNHIYISGEYSKKEHKYEAPAACPQIIEDSFQELIINDYDNFQDDSYDNDDFNNEDENINNAENENDDLGENAQGNIFGDLSTTSTSNGAFNDSTINEEGGGGRNGGRSLMGDVMTVNDQNNNNDMTYTSYRNIDYGNDNNYSNNNEQNDNNFYEDNFNSNFGDVGLQIVVNGNDTNFFV